VGGEGGEGGGGGGGGLVSGRGKVWVGGGGVWWGREGGGVGGGSRGKTDGTCRKSCEILENGKIDNYTSLGFLC